MEAAAAAVLKPPVMAEVDCNSKSLNAELEVKKLQELVRRLEHQNEQLRNRTGGGPPSPLFHRSLSPDHFISLRPNRAAVWHHQEEEELSVLDELELLDLDLDPDPICASDEETWLYSSLKHKETSDYSLTPLQWCRQVLDGPKSEVEAARRSLSLRLEQVSRWRGSLSSSPSSSCPPAPPQGRVAVSPITVSPSVKSCSTPQSSESHAPPLFSPLQFHQTSSPVGKELSPVAERTPTFLPHLANRSRLLRHSTLSPQSSVDGDVGAAEMDDDSISLGYKLHDLTDVQVMARLQEESLRQDYASMSSVLANRRSQSFTFHLNQLSAAPDLEEEDEEEEDYGLLPPPQPRLTRLPHSHTFSSVRDWQRSTSSLSTPPSTPSTPPRPSAGFTFHGQHPGLGLGSPYLSEQQVFRPGPDKLRRSMPNLTRTPSMPCVPILTNPSASPSLLRNSQSFDSSSGLAFLQPSIPTPGQLQNRVQSVGNFASLSQQPLKATAYVSPTIKGSVSMATSSSLQALNVSGVSSGIPLFGKATSRGGSLTVTTPRSSLPRPASFVCTTSSTPHSKIAQPARSLLPKSLSTFSALRDTTWRDGLLLHDD
ncbi:LOW QUALITY PROTEIN: SLAIN motif-containing protein 1-like [Thalassophryne amazonica]|uniref:LOW QUALITY PROTEIN: SLAIN motif-containing protein 1-like n=1 Tax=Thalassophryne amazonica TaxID=390379 RepID=UPI001470BEB4|nr:LOW QUALITY PROTEIN: SLAIN motif-containing protein 1-like [Thalassophryne amazonica]